MTIHISPRTQHGGDKTQKTTNLEHILSVLILGRNGRDPNSVSQSFFEVVSRPPSPSEEGLWESRTVNE